MMDMAARAVIKKELLTGLRDARPFAFLAVFIVLLILGLLLLLEIIYSERLDEVGVIDAQFVALLFTDFSQCLYLSALLLVPPMAAVSICSERQQDSYDLLQMTYIRPLSLAVAKLSHVLGIYLLVVVATLPFVGATFFLIGVDWMQFVATLTLIVMAAFSLSVIGLLCSAKYHQTLPAIMATYVLGYAAQGGLLVAADLTSKLISGGSILYALPDSVLVATYPFRGITLIGRQGAGLSTLLPVFLYHGALVGLGLFLVMRTLRNATRPAASAPPLIDDPKRLAARRWQFPYYLIDPSRRRALIPDGQNPVQAKELRASMLGLDTAAARLFCGFAVFTFLTSLVCMDLYGKHNNLAAMSAWTFHYVTIFIVLLVPSLVATAVAKEWEWENVDSLRSTLLSSDAVFSGKVTAALRIVAAPVLGTVAGAFPLAIFGRASWEAWHGAAMGVSVLLLAPCYAVALSTWATVSFRRSMTALLTAYGACGVAFALSPAIVLVLSRATVERVHAIEDPTWFYSFFSPLIAFYTVVKYGREADIALLNGYWLANVCFFTGASVCLLYRARRRFRQAVNREYV